MKDVGFTKKLSKILASQLSFISILYLYGYITILVNLQPLYYVILQPVCLLQLNEITAWRLMSYVYMVIA